MRTPRSIPDAVRRLQLDASDPDVSAWVAANAGAGKTYVLAQRVINLLLKGTEPEKILCITFTKAAAANMAKHVFDRLAHWTTLDDAKLDQAIRDHSRMKPDAALRARARRLFARALETPGGLKVQTIHAFCTQLLHQFPFEANVAARFSVLDDAEHSQLLERLTLAVLLDGAAAPDSRLGRALAFAMTAAADQTFRDVVREAIGQHDVVMGWVEKAGDVDAAIASLSKQLGIDPKVELDKIEAEYFSGEIITPAEWLGSRRNFRSGQQVRSRSGRAFPQPGDAVRRRACRRLSRYLLYQRWTHAAQLHRHQGDQGYGAGRAARRRAAARLRAFCKRLAPSSVVIAAPPCSRSRMRSCSAITPKRSAAGCSITTT